MSRRVDGVLRRGTVVDGSGSPPFRADVAVDQGRIVEVAESAPHRGDVEVDCEGRIVCPGFVDVHAHDDLAALMPGGLAPKIAQGVTSTIVGNCGHGAAPCGMHSSEIHSYSSPVLGPGPDGWPWPTFRDYLRVVREAEPPIRVHHLVPHGVARMAVMGFAARASTPSEEAAIAAAVRAGLEVGAVGASFGLMYAPACFAQTSELVAVAREVAAHDGVLAVHLRAEGEHIFAALAELHEIVVASGVSVHVSHLKCTGSRNHGRMVDVVRELERWRAGGITVTADVYPYTAGSTTICAMLPEFALEGGVDHLLHRLTDARFRDAVERALVRPWDRTENHLLACGPDKIVLTSLRHPGNVGFEGSTLADVARARGVPAEVALLTVIREEHGRAGVIQHQGSESDLVTAMEWPHTMVGSDGLPASPGTKPHPRLFGTFPRVLNRYVKHAKVWRLEDAISRMTGQPARRFGLADEGVIRPGGHADLVVLDLETVADTATYEDPQRPPSGVDHVWVSGRPLVAPV